MFDPFMDMDKFFEDMPMASAGFVPALDVYQDADNVIIETPLPGVDPKDVNISVENDVLTIEGSSEKKSEVDEKNYYRKEVRYGSFHRAVALPCSVDGDQADAQYKDGMLRVSIPKAATATKKTIKVSTK